MKKIFYILLIAVLSSCAAVDHSSRNETVSKLIQEQQWEITNDWAFPLTTTSTNIMYNAGLIPPGSTGNRINLIGNTNYVKKVGDSISVYLPFFGDRQFGGGYNTGNSAIAFDGIPKNLNTLETRKSELKKYRIEFKEGTESYRGILIIYNNGTTEMTIYGSHRSSMRYTGHLKKLELLKTKNIVSN